MSDPVETAIFEKLARADPGGVGGKSIEPADVARAPRPEVLPYLRQRVRGILGSW